MLKTSVNANLSRIVIYCRSYPLARTRLNRKKGIYQPLSAQEESIYWLYQYEPLKIDYPIKIDVTYGFFKTGKLLHPVSPTIGDIDNHIKALLDNLQRTDHLVDDRFVIEINAIKTWSTSNFIDIKFWRIK